MIADEPKPAISYDHDFAEKICKLQEHFEKMPGSTTEDCGKETPQA